MATFNSVNDGLIQQMATYSFDSRIKVSYIFEDYDSDATDILEDLSPEEPVEHAPVTEKNDTAGTESLPSTSSEFNSNNASFNDLKHTPNIKHGLPTNLEGIIEHKNNNNKTIMPVNSCELPFQNNTRKESSAKPLQSNDNRNYEINNINTIYLPNTNSYLTSLQENTRHEENTKLDEQSNNMNNEINNKSSKSPKAVNSHIDARPNTSLQNTENNISLAPSNENSPINNLLDTLSNNLICITKYYHFFNTNYSTNQRATRESYLSFKHHYYNLSYSVSVSLILPNENNHAFIKNFIIRTIEMANSNFWYNISFSLLQYIIKDMIQWTKQKKKYLDACNNQLMQACNILPKNANTVSNVNPNIYTENRNNIRLFSNGLPGNEISISIDATTLKSSQNILRENVPAKRTYVPSTTKQKDLLSKKKKTIHDVRNQNIPTYTLNSPILNNNHVNNTSILNQTLPSSNFYNSNTTIQPLNSHQSWPISRQNDKDYETNEPQSPLTRSSVSRDSGFGSPNLAVNEHTTCMEISHVTSLNPEALFIASGQCKICGSPTRTKCIGCYKYYYCSTLCQKIDWPTHALECNH